MIRVGLGIDAFRRCTHPSETDGRSFEASLYSSETPVALLARREQYTIPPEQPSSLLTQPGTFQHGRLDLPDENIQDRVDAGETLLAVIRALERADGLVETAADVRWIVVGMQDSDDIPSKQDVKSALQLLGHPRIGVVEQTEEGYRIVTSYENAIQLVRSLGEVVQPPEEEK